MNVCLCVCGYGFLIVNIAQLWIITATRVDIIDYSALMAFCGAEVGGSMSCLYLTVICAIWRARVDIDSSPQMRAHINGKHQAVQVPISWNLTQSPVIMTIRTYSLPPAFFSTFPFFLLCPCRLILASNYILIGNIVILFYGSRQRGLKILGKIKEVELEFSLEWQDEKLLNRNSKVMRSWKWRVHLPPGSTKVKFKLKTNFYWWYACMYVCMYWNQSIFLSIYGHEPSNFKPSKLSNKALPGWTYS